jgi:phospholipid-translocating ATPase
MNKLKNAWNTVSNFDIATAFSRKYQPGPKRTVFVNEPLPADYFNKKGKVLKDHVYHSNQVITSKYTIITFIPRNLLEQFRRVANVCVTNYFVICC